VVARFELSGTGILNVVHYCAVEVLADQSCRLDLQRLESGIRQEYIKEGKVVYATAAAMVTIGLFTICIRLFQGGFSIFNLIYQSHANRLSANP
jgi:hypothetical protein